MTSPLRDASAVLAERARQLARPGAPDKPDGVQPMVVFERDGASYALPLTAVDEILAITSLTRLPARLAPVTGLTAVHGRIAAAVDLRGLLGQAATEPPARAPWGVVLSGASLPVVLPIQGVKGIEDVDASGLYATASHTPDGARPVRGLTAAGVAVLDAGALTAAIDDAMQRDETDMRAGAN